MVSLNIEADHLKMNQGEELDSILICTICQGILVNPKECKLCQRSFCTPCLDKWRVNSSICPNQCKNPHFTNSHLVIRNSLDKLKFRCYNKSCEVVLSYADKISGKHEDICAVANDSTLVKLNEDNRFVITCSFCNQKMALREVSAHEKECSGKVQKSKDIVETCNFCLERTDQYEACSTCHKFYCERRCLSKCDKCEAMFCLKKCSSICYCMQNVYCTKCSPSFEETEITCEICNNQQMLKCDKCKLKSNCGGCKKKICLNCSMFCTHCNDNKCIDCLWLCIECHSKKCICDVQYNAFVYAILSVFYLAYFFIKPKEFKKWNLFLKVMYAISVSIFVFPAILSIVVVYFVIGLLFCEYTNSVCQKCRDKTFDKT